MDKKIQEVINELDKKQDRIRYWSTYNNKIIKTVSTVLFPTATSIWLALCNGNDLPSYKWYILYALFIVQIVFAVICIFMPETIVKSYIKARDIATHYDDIKSKLKISEQDNKKLINLTGFSYFWLTLSFLDKERFKNGITDVMSHYMDPIINMAEDIFGFKNKEIWSFSYYCYDEPNDILNCVWRETHRNHPSHNKLGRPWQPGHGHVGLAFSRKRTISTEDNNSHDIRQVTRPTDSNEIKNYDESIYVSFAAVPVICPLDNASDIKPYGVLVATSNLKNRFDEENVFTLEIVALELANFLCKHDI